MSNVNQFLIFILHETRSLNHIILGPSCCKFAVSCTQYAAEQLKEKRLLSALWAICKRLLSCNPFSSTYF